MVSGVGSEGEDGVEPASYRSVKCGQEGEVQVARQGHAYGA